MSSEQNGSSALSVDVRNDEEGDRRGPLRECDNVARLDPLVTLVRHDEPSRVRRGSPRRRLKVGKNKAGRSRLCGVRRHLGELGVGRRVGRWPRPPSALPGSEPDHFAAEWERAIDLHAPRLSYPRACRTAVRLVAMSLSRGKSEADSTAVPARRQGSMRCTGTPPGLEPDWPSWSRLRKLRVSTVPAVPRRFPAHVP